MNSIFTIIRVLCKTWKPKWQGMVMAELVYHRGDSDGLPDVETYEGRAIRLTASYGYHMERLSIVLLPYKETEPKPMKRWEEDQAISFTEDSIHQDSFLLGDHNSIHQGKNPVVSGFEILMAIEKYFPKQDIKIRFYAPARAGEWIFLHKEEGKITGYTNHLCFICEETV